MATVSSVTGRASAGRPSSRERDAEVVQRCGEVGAVTVRAGGGQLPVHGDGFLRDRQGVRRAAQLGERDAEVAQRAGEVGAVTVRARGGQFPADRDGFLGGGQRLGQAAQFGEP